VPPSSLHPSPSSPRCCLASPRGALSAGRPASQTTTNHPPSCLPSSRTSSQEGLRRGLRVSVSNSRRWRLAPPRPPNALLPLFRPIRARERPSGPAAMRARIACIAKVPNPGRRGRMRDTGVCRNGTEGRGSHPPVLYLSCARASAAVVVSALLLLLAFAPSSHTHTRRTIVVTHPTTNSPRRRRQRRKRRAVAVRRRRAQQRRPPRRARPRATFIRACARPCRRVSLSSRGRRRLPAPRPAPRPATRALHLWWRRRRRRPRADDLEPRRV
jgi:hypothetical protein